MTPKTFFEKTFADFKVNVESVNPKRIDYNSNAFALKYKSIISTKYLEGVNFAGHYSLTQWNCGSDCGMSAIVDFKTGKVYNGPDCESGMKFQKNSKLVISNPPDSLGYYDAYSIFSKPRYYLWENNKLTEIKK